MSSKNNAEQELNFQITVEAVDSASPTKKRKEQAGQTLYITRI